MSPIDHAHPVVEETPVDDVRRVRERLSAAFGNDVRALAEHARRVTDEYRAALGLQSADMPAEKADISQ